MTPEELAELQSLTEELEELTARMRRLYEERNVPNHVPLVARPDDHELMALARDMEAYNARNAAFWARFPSSS